MKEIIVNVCTSVICLMLASALYYAARWIHEKCVVLKNSVESEALKTLIEKIDYIVQICVEATNQTFVDNKKENEDFNESDQKEAFDKTFESIELMLTDADKEKIANTFGDISTFIRTSIENYIKNSKLLK